MNLFKKVFPIVIVATPLIGIAMPAIPGIHSQEKNDSIGTVVDEGLICINKVTFS